MAALADELAQELLEPAVVEHALDLGERLLVVDVVERALVVVEPRRHCRHAQRDAVGVAAPVALAQVELCLCQGRRELLAWDAVLGEAAALAFEQRAELASAARAHALQREHGLRLKHAVDEGRLEVVGKAGVHDGALER